MPQNSQQRDELRDEEKRQQQITPAAALEIGKDPSLIGQSFPSGKKIAETHDFNAINTLETFSAMGMRGEDNDIELVTKPPAKLENKRRLLVTLPAREGGGQHQDSFSNGHCPYMPAW
ncbi:hypothetical protein FGKAn22_17270 [Ferrigenium kumadai]|uniref:Uncharacterized protein n=1 Tax=Ferrigenium kumadai TaxID=1682490 RepID=A0AAN1T1S8_9PROT|nr:hypothetical protein FGKAn22_17270 [Ferrigenium kumadai]